MTVCVAVSAWDPVGSESWVMPKSSTRTRPSAAYAMLPGLMSRCTSPRACAASRADATWRPTSTTSSTGSGPSASSSARLGPGSSSMTMKAVSPSTPLSCTVTTFGWLRPAVARASRSNRAAPDSSRRERRSIVLTATWRPSTVSVPRQTSPMPPRPMGASRT